MRVFQSIAVFFDKILGLIVTFIVSPLIMVILYSMELMKSMRRVSFYKTYPFSCLFVILTLILSFVQTDTPPTHEHIGLDKIVCSFFYFIMTSVFWIEYLRHHKMRFVDYNWAWFPCIVGPIIMSGVIEITQSYFIESRKGEWMDFLFNSMGIGLSALVWSVCLAKLKKMKVISKVQNYER